MGASHLVKTKQTMTDERATGLSSLGTPCSTPWNLIRKSKSKLLSSSWSGYEDELAWGAAWMYKATGDGQYLDLAKQIFNSNSMCNSNLWFGWDNKVAGVQVLMYDLTGQDPEYKTCVDNYMNALDSATYTPKGLIFVDNWGSNRHAGNNAHLCAQVVIQLGSQSIQGDPSGRSKPPVVIDLNLEPKRFCTHARAQ